MMVMMMMMMMLMTMLMTMTMTMMMMMMTTTLMMMMMMRMRRRRRRRTGRIWWGYVRSTLANTQLTGPERNRYPKTSPPPLPLEEFDPPPQIVEESILLGISPPNTEKENQQISGPHKYPLHGFDRPDDSPHSETNDMAKRPHRPYAGGVLCVFYCFFFLAPVFPQNVWLELFYWAAFRTVIETIFKMENLTDNRIWN